MSKIIIGVEVEKRRDIANAVQDILTEYGCFIKTRIGLHDASDDRSVCSESGIIILELIKNADNESSSILDELSAISGVVAKTIRFD